MDNDQLNIVFFGTSSFAVPILKKLISDERFVIKAVITQPDRPVGRQQQLEKSPVKLLAENHNLPVLQPADIKDPIVAEGLQVLDADINIVAAYGQIIPDDILNHPQYKSVNVHSSLLPFYRGASPIHNAILNGESETGVTIMLMDAKMDHGPILSQEKVAISDNDITPTLEAKLAEVGADLLINTTIDWVEGNIKPQAQNHKKATFTKMLKRGDGQIDWENPADYIIRQLKAFTPWPGVYTFWGDKKIQLLDINVIDKQLEPGLVSQENDWLIIGCKDKAIKINQLQLAGKNPTSSADFLRGHSKIVGVKLK